MAKAKKSQKKKGTPKAKPQSKKVAPRVEQAKAQKPKPVERKPAPVEKPVVVAEVKKVEPAPEKPVDPTPLVLENIAPAPLPAGVTRDGRRIVNQAKPRVFKTIARVRIRGKQYLPGATVQMSNKEAEILFAQGAIEEVK